MRLCAGRCPKLQCNGRIVMLTRRGTQARAVRRSASPTGFPGKSIMSRSFAYASSSREFNGAPVSLSWRESAVVRQRGGSLCGALREKHPLRGYFSRFAEKCLPRRKDRAQRYHATTGSGPNRMAQSSQIMPVVGRKSGRYQSVLMRGHGKHTNKHIYIA